MREFDETFFEQRKLLRGRLVDIKKVFQKKEEETEGANLEDERREITMF